MQRILFFDRSGGVESTPVSTLNRSIEKNKFDLSDLKKLDKKVKTAVL